MALSKYCAQGEHGHHCTLKGCSCPCHVGHLEFASFTEAERDQALARCVNWINLARRYGIQAADAWLHPKEHP